MRMDPGPSGVRSDINVTPLVDVVLVLLIVFLVVTPLLQRGKPVQLPAAERASELGRGGDPVLLTVTADGRTWLAEREVAREELAGALAAELAARPGAPVVLRGDRELDYAAIRAVVREVTKARVAGVSLAVTQVQGGE